MSLAALDTVEIDVPGYAGRVLRYRDVTLYESSPYVVKGVLHAGEVVLLYGAAKSGKTFYASHLAADVANGREHRGRRTRRGLVVHVALESVSAIINRTVAYRQATGETDLPLVVLDWHLDLFDVTSRDRLKDTLRQLEAEYKLPLVLLIIDTLSRATPGCDENSRELGDAIGYAHDIVRHHFAEAGALVIHHAGKDAARGARGHSSVYGNADGILTVENVEGRRLVSVDVHRNATEGEVIAAFELEPVTIGTDADGDPIASCTLFWTDTPADRPAVQERLSPKQKLLLDALHRVVSKSGLYPPTELSQALDAREVPTGRSVIREDDLITEAVSAGITTGKNAENQRRSVKSLIDALQAKRKISRREGFVWKSKA